MNQLERIKRELRPKQLQKRLQHARELLRGRVLMAACELDRYVYCGDHVIVQNRGGRIRIGNGTAFVPGPVHTELRCHQGAELAIGAHTICNYGVLFEAADTIQVGEHCMFASFTVISNADPARPGPIVIEDDVWVAHGAVIRGGVRIGRGSVVSARAVVESDIRPGALAIGNPARAMSLDMVAPPDADEKRSSGA